MLLASSAIQAQLADSLFLNENNFYGPIEDKLWENPLFYTSQKLSDFTQTQIDFGQKDLNFKRVQTAEKVTEYNFSTKGIFNIQPKLRLFGEFLFNRTFEKNLGYNFTSQRTENQNVLNPNYFYAPRKGDWEIQNYHLKGGFSYQFNSNLLLATTAFYENGKNFRKDDPRPEIESSNYGGNIHLGYAYGNHKLFVLGGMAQKTEKSSIIYVDDTKNAPVYPETFTRFSSGYGRIIFNSSYTANIFRTVDKNFGAGYQFQNNRNSIGISYKYNKSMENFYGRDGRGKVYIDEDLIQFKYKVVSHFTNLNYYYDGEKLDYKLDFKYNKNQGDNFSVAERGQNYRMNQEFASLYGGIIKKENNRVLYGLELGANYARQKYADLLGSTNKKVNSIEIEAILNRDVLALQKNKLNLQLSLKNYTAIDEALLYIPASSNTSFADNVIIPDHAFDATSKLQSKILAQHYITLPKNRTLRIFANYATLIALDKKYQEYVSDFETKYNTYLNAGISINY